MSKFAIIVSQAVGQFDYYMELKHGVVARAATATMDETRDNLVASGRQSIASAGFPKGMQMALRGVRYPRHGNSISAAVHVWHRSLYGGVFEYGATIEGKPLLWLPFSNIPPKLGSQKISPSLLISKGINLVSLRSKKGTPLLGAPVPVRKWGDDVDGDISWSQIKAGRNTSGPFRTIPLFHGQRQVTVGKKFDVTGEAEKARRAVPSIFTKHFKDDV